MTVIRNHYGINTCGCLVQQFGLWVLALLPGIFKLILFGDILLEDLILLQIDHSHIVNLLLLDPYSSLECPQLVLNLQFQR